ncbi:MAG: ATP-binding protein [Gemmatimonadota bacterium]|nr:ATP-binding protein [Gemmatimonadota bacterium]
MSPREARRLFGRDALLTEVREYLAKQYNVLLLGPRDVGKSAIIRALGLDGVMILDPFMSVAPRLAGSIRRAMDRGVQCVAATRTVNRAEMGAVRRLAFRFTTVRVPPLTARWVRRILATEYAEQGWGTNGVPSVWTEETVRLVDGLPGLAVAVVRAAAEVRARTGHLPSPRTALVEADIQRVELYSAHGQFGARRPVLRSPPEL